MSKVVAPRLTPQQFSLVAISVLAAVLAHAWRLPWPFGALILAIFSARWLQRARSGARIPTALKLPLILLFPFLVILHYGTVFGREPGAALACAMLVLKLVETETRRDARAAVTFSCFVLMSALLFDSSLGFTLILFALLALFLATLRELEPRPSDAPPLLWRKMFAANLRSGALSLLAALPLCLCVFVFFPRLGSPLWGAPSDSTAARTGLGDSMAPGTMQELLIDDSPAFRVSFDGALPEPKQRYWRGPVLTQFDGNAWTRPGWLSNGYRAETLQVAGDPVGYEVALEPTDRRWLLALDVPLAAPANAVRGADMSLVSRSPIDQLLRYRLSSALRYRLDPQIDSAERTRTLELPKGFDPRALAKAQEWRGQFNDDDAIIKAALELFHNEFFYTLAPPLLGRDSIDDFLFETHRGFCEHFASAFAFLMRAAGIPARVVTGYQGGYFNSVGNYLVVRQSDAHAWTEVWLQDRGWVRVDPTAAVSPQRVELGARAAAGSSAEWYQSSWLLSLRNRFDLVNRGWNNLIVQFNALRQQSMLAPFGIDKVEYNELVSILLGLSTVLIGLFSWFVLRRPRSHRDFLDLAYVELCRKLARMGVTTTANEGARSFAMRLRSSPANSPSIQRLFDEYVSLRYAHALPPLSAVRGFAKAVRGLRTLRTFSKFNRFAAARAE